MCNLQPLGAGCLAGYGLDCIYVALDLIYEQLRLSLLASLCHHFHPPTPASSMETPQSGLFLVSQPVEEPVSFV